MNSASVLHIVDNKTGEKFKYDIGKDGKKIIDETFENNVLSELRYKRYEFLDCSNGRMGEKVRCCKIFEVLYYFPLWVFISYWLSIVALLSSIIYCSVYISNYQNATSYGGTCYLNTDCNLNKGLYCRLMNRTSQDYCDCPGYSTINTCDCPSSYFWNGNKCTAVYTYGKGPCFADYSCQNGLICNQTTSTCLCPVLKPNWDESTKICSHKYLGCFYNCLNTSLCDFYTSSILIQSSNNYQIELDTCLMMCNARNYKYANIVHFSNFKCACSNTYNSYATVASDFDCSYPCSVYYPTIINRCPLPSLGGGRFSSFQIGS